MDEAAMDTHIPHDLEKVLGVKAQIRSKAQAFTQAFLKRNTEPQPQKDAKGLLSHKAVILEYSRSNKKILHKKRPKGLNAQQKREIKIFHIKSEHQSSPHSVQQKLLKADFHGAIITVVRSKCPSYVGTTGILIQEFKHVFKMITKQDKFKEQRGSVLGCRRARLLFLPWMESVGSGVRGGRRGASAEASGRRRPGWAGGQPSSPGRAFHSSGECSIAGQRSGLHSPAEIYETDIIPKRNSVFQVEINGFISFIYGNKFEQRASERSAKKFKFSGSIDL
ncbi:ribonuclease P protein subunit p29 isoform X5 [Syngnathus typhle]|uniref:ribonuclease P protein subunit p29 isoform X5 n=1 Tax=Syngnathus typhle TaxID=161592 RepID=UPI002A6B234A|nr:ribonuclease P protein subunit p29 isoform X5 [Syngnathus typhle]